MKTERQKSQIELNYEKNLEELIFAEEEKYNQDEDFDFGAMLPIISCIGVILYFRANIVIPSYYTYIALPLFVLSRLFQKFVVITSVVLFFLIGFYVSELRFHSLEKNTNIKKKIEDMTVKAKIKEIKIGEFSDRFVMEIEYANKRNLTGSLRCNIDKNLITKGVNIGDIIRFDADIFALPRPIYPNAYNFSEVAKFSGIIGICKPKTEIEVVKKNVDYLRNFFEIIRTYINKTLAIKSSTNDEIGVSMALITANKEYITKEANDSIKKAGLAHLLAISGLHITMIALASFLIIKRFIVKNEYILLHYSVKKISAIFALFVSFVYLQISGMPVSANRSFIMFSIGMIAILMNKNAFSLRSLSVAAFVIILYKPESIFDPSFQMSFMAVLSLISSSRRFYIISRKDIHKFIKLLLYALQIAITSGIATIGTSIYSIYHFNQFSIVGIVTNVIAVPMTEFFVMPFIITGLFLSVISSGLGEFFIRIGQIFAGFIVKLSHFSSSFKYSYVMISQMPSTSLLLHTIGLLIAFLAKKKLKYISIIFFITGLLLHILNKKPIAIITRDDNVIFRYSDSYYSKFHIDNDFMNMSYSGKLGQDIIKSADDNIISNVFKMNDGYSVYEDNGVKLIIPNERFSDQDCSKLSCKSGMRCFFLNKFKIYKQVCRKVPRGMRIIKHWDIIKNGVFIIK